MPNTIRKTKRQPDKHTPASPAYRGKTARERYTMRHEARKSLFALSWDLLNPPEVWGIDVSLVNGETHGGDMILRRGGAVTTIPYTFLAGAVGGLVAFGDLTSRCRASAELFGFTYAHRNPYEMRLWQYEIENRACGDERFSQMLKLIQGSSSASHLMKNGDVLRVYYLHDEWMVEVLPKGASSVVLSSLETYLKEHN